MKVSKFSRLLSILLCITMIFSIAIQGIGGASAASSYSNDNLLRNAGFESELANSGWSTWQTASRDTAVYRSGSASGKLTQTSSGGASLEQDISGLQVGVTYVFTAWVKVSGTISGEVSLGVKNFGDTQKVVYPQSDSDWTELSVEFTYLDSSKPARVFLWHAGASDAIIYIDDATLVTKNGIESATITNGSINVTVDNTDATVQSFTATVESSLDAGVVTDLPLAGSVEGGVANLTFTPIEASPAEQTVTVRLTYGSETIELDYVIEANGGSQVVANIVSVSATNGTATVVLDNDPTVTPVASNFTLTVNQTATTIEGFNYDKTTKTATLTFSKVVVSSDSDTNATLTVTYNDSSADATFSASKYLPTSIMTATAGSSQSGQGADNVLDGDTSTLWHTAWAGAERSLHYITFELSEYYNVTALEYTPRTSQINGIITKYTISGSNDNENWTTITDGTWEQNSSVKTATFDKACYKYYKLTSVESASDSSSLFTSAAEIRLIGDSIGETPYTELSNLISTAKATYFDGSYANNGAYRELEKAISKYSAYTATTLDADVNNAINDMNSLIDGLVLRELSVEAIDRTILSENADDNSHAANGGNDGDAKFLFDESNATMWHSYYSNGGGNGLRPYSDTESVNATHPIWMQTGFGGTEYITKIECKPRTDSGTSNLTNQVKTYEVYVSNSDTKPIAVVSTSETNDWTLVKSGTLTTITASSTEQNHVITFSQPIEAKWIRLVVTSTTGTYSCIANMNVYKLSDSATATIGTQIADKIAEAEALLNSATVNETDATYTAYQEALTEIAAIDLTTEATQELLDNLTAKIADLKFTAEDGTTYTGAAQQTINSINEKIEEAKHIIMQAGVNSTALEAQIASLEAETRTVTTSVDELTNKLTALQTQIDTAKANEKEVNKADTLASDSVKWNNTEQRLTTLREGVETNVANDIRHVTYIFDGDYSLNATASNFYGSWRENTSEQQVPWISIKLGESVCVSGLVIFDRLTSGGTTAQNCFKNYEIRVSNDADFNNYIVAASGTRTNTTYSASGYEIKFDQPYDCQYIKFVTYGDVDCKIVEMDIYEYVGSKESKTITVTTSNSTSIAVGADLGTISLNKKFTNGFSKEELERQLINDIDLSDIAHNYVISVDATTLELSVVASDNQYKLMINNNGTTTEVQTKKYGENFDYAVENAKGWTIDGKVVCNGNTFNYKATDNITATAVLDGLVQSVSAYIPEPVISYNGTKTTIQIPVYINGTTDYTDKGIVFVKSGTDEQTIKSAILGTASNSVKKSSAGNNETITLTNKGRYIHTITFNGNLPAGDFYAYVVTTDAEGTKTVTLSNAQSRQLS